MFEHVLIVGLEKDESGYNARWANTETVCSGKTPEEAIVNLFKEMYPGIWELSDDERKAMVKVKVPKDGGLFSVPKFVKRGKGVVAIAHAPDEEPRFIP